MAWEVILALAVAALFAIVQRYCTNSNQKLKVKPRPPHPPSWPIIGHLHLLHQKRSIHRILSSLSDTYGPIIHLQLGFRPLLLISSSDLAKQCFTTNDRAFASRPHLASSRHMGYDYKMLAATPYGSYWRNILKMCTIQILSATRIESFKQARLEEISALIRSLFESWQRDQASQVNMKSRLSDLTFNIILRLVANKRVSEPVHSKDFQEAQHFKEMIEESFFLAGAFEAADYLPFLKWFDLQGLVAAMKNLHKKRDVFMQKLVNDHREKRGKDANADADPQDLIDVLISATDNHQIQSADNNDDVVKATALSMISAGTDTSSVTIEWALASLLQHPHVLTKAQEELDTHIGRERLIEEADLNNLKYLQAIVKETLRLYPAAPLLVPHESIEACSVGGYCVPAGTRLLVNAWAIHRDPAVWERPMEFDPERFLKSGEDIDVKGQHFELIPFGSGRRMCPGMSLALTIVTHTLGRLLQSFKWSIPEGTTINMGEGFGITMPKAVPLQTMMKPRIPLHFYSDVSAS